MGVLMKTHHFSTALSTSLGKPNRFPSPAKLNLFLYINGKLPNGYHELQTLFQFQILIHKTISFFDLIFLQVLFNLHGLCRMQTSKSLFGFIL